MFQGFSHFALRAYARAVPYGAVKALFFKAARAVYNLKAGAGHYRFGKEFLQQFKLDKCNSGVRFYGFQLRDEVVTANAGNSSLVSMAACLLQACGMTTKAMRGETRLRGQTQQGTA
ncbi:MAG: hypothetical protein KJ667_06240 [Alphaproteobacteria bacterium]|nr:hypothetical protein [Alphaproteobacteria bacterium]